MIAFLVKVTLIYTNFLWEQIIKMFKKNIHSQK
jgi:hypothetical protein